MLALLHSLNLCMILDCSPWMRRVIFKSAVDIMVAV